MQGEFASQSVEFQQFFNVESEKSVDDCMHELASLLKSNNFTIAVIESITGGGLARKIVETAGCSSYFLGGVVAYSPALKVQLGQVNPKTISTHGVISAAVAEEMATGIKQRTMADITIATTGIAGPKNDVFGIEQNGTVFLSWNICGNIKKTKRFKIEGGRNEVIDKTVYTVNKCL